MISFDNTELAFAYKTNKELKKARFLFSSMGIGWLVKLGTRLTPWAIQAGLPINGVIRKTIFQQFVGGETLSETATGLTLSDPWSSKSMPADPGGASLQNAYR